MSHALELEPRPESVGAARRWCLRRAQEEGWDQQAETLVLLVSELVTNVVLHARTPCELRVEGGDGVVRVEVADGSDRLPGRLAPADPLGQSGRGMVLVRSLSSASGVEIPPEGGKRVWFELPLDPQP